MRRLGGAAGRVFFMGSGGGGAGCRGLGAVPDVTSSSPKGPRPTAGRGRLSQAVMGGWFGWPGGPGAWGARGEVSVRGELGKRAAGAGGTGGHTGPAGGRLGIGGGGGGRRGDPLEVGEVASEVTGTGRGG